MTRPAPRHAALAILACAACASSAPAPRTADPAPAQAPAAAQASTLAPAPSAKQAPAPAAGQAPGLAPTQPATVASSRPAAGTEAARVAAMLARVEKVRELASTKPVPGVVLDRAALIARVKAHVARELPPQAIRNEGLELQLFGFLPTGFDYEAAEYDLLEEQLAGYYEPADGTMYLASDLQDDEAEATLAHELVHALQDQHWDLERRSRYHPGTGDQAETVSALAEGDATSAMYDMIVPKVLGAHATALDVPDIAGQIREGISQGPGAKAPHVMRSSLAAPYIYGSLFVNELRRQGGWAAVDRAWGDPPATSEQILHVEKWLAHEPALPVHAPPFASLGPGWSVADEDSEGELGTRTAFEEWLPLEGAADASGGWGGDRAVLVTSGDKAAFGWRLRYDRGDGAAARAYKAIARGLEEALGPVSARGDGAVCRERGDRGPFAIGHKDGDIVITLGPARVATTWSSAGGCALALRWLREIAASPR
jgi:hypothetical protein